VVTKLSKIRDLSKAERNIYILAFTSLLLNIAVNLYDPFLSLYFINLSASTALLGIVFAVYRVAYAVAMLPGGYLADRFGRKNLIVIGSLVFAAFLLPMSLAGSWILALAFLVCAQLGISMYQPGTSAMIAESLTSEARAAGFGKFWSIVMVGSLIGPVIAGYLSMGSNYGILFLFASLIMFGVTFIRFKFLVETKKGVILKNASKEGFVDKLKLIWGVGSGVKFYLIYSCISEFGFQLMIPYMSVYWGYVIHMNEFLIGIGFATFMLFMILSQIPGGKLSDRIGRKPCLIVSAFGSTVTTIVMLFCTDPAQVILMQALGGVFAGLGHGPHEALSAELVDESVRGTALGVFRTTSGLIGAIGPLAAGLICGVYSFEVYPKIIFYLYGAVNSVAAILLALFVEETLNKYSLRDEKSPQQMSS